MLWHAWLQTWSNHRFFHKFRWDIGAKQSAFIIWCRRPQHLAQLLQSLPRWKHRHDIMFEVLPPFPPRLLLEEKIWRCKLPIFYEKTVSKNSHFTTLKCSSCDKEFNRHPFSYLRKFYHTFSRLWHINPKRILLNLDYQPNTYQLDQTYLRLEVA